MEKEKALQELKAHAEKQLMDGLRGVKDKNGKKDFTINAYVKIPSDQVTGEIVKLRQQLNAIWRPLNNGVRLSVLKFLIGYMEEIANRKPTTEK